MVCCCTFGYQCIVGTKHIQREMFFDEDATSFVEHEKYLILWIQINERLKCVPMVDVCSVDSVVGLHDNTGDLLWTIQFDLIEGC